MFVTKDKIVDNLDTIPEQPGCYRYLNKKEEVIYVGKAKNLRRRISSYFQKEHDDAKTRALVRNIHSLEYIVVDTEHDALLLEYNLIKQYRPRYNIMLKNGNFYPSICVKNEPFPRIFSTHKVVRDGSQYFGPYPNGAMSRALMYVIRKAFMPRTCSLNLTEENIASGKFKVCLNYHIKRCKGPCEGLQTKEDYDEKMHQAKEVLKGNVTEVKRALEEKMLKLSEEMRFEEAQEAKVMLEALENYQGQSAIVSGTVGNALVLSYAQDTESFYVNYLEVRNGHIVSGETLEYKKRIEEESRELLATILQEIYEDMEPGIKELILPVKVDFAPEGVTVINPQRGAKRRLLDLSIKNVQQYRIDKDKLAEKLNPEQRNTQLLKELQQMLGLPKLPYHMECFDNSNIQGSDPVAACVVFKGAKPVKEEYRHYHIKTVEGPDDYASMAEVVKRRYTSLMEEEKSLPDLIVTDGGKGHMETVREALAEIGLSIPILGLAKDKRHKTANILFGNPPEVIGVMQRSPVFHLLERLQNEVHRFAIKFHRNVRSKRQTKSELDEIKGVGPVTKKTLMRTFKSLKRIKETSLEELQNAVGEAKGELVYNYFNKKNE